MRTLPLLERMIDFGKRTALVDEKGAIDYRSLIELSARLAAGILSFRKESVGDRYAILLKPGNDFAIALLGIWRAGKIAVPLSLKHTPSEWEHAIGDSGCAGVITSEDFADEALKATSRLGAKRLDVAKLKQFPFANFPEFDQEAGSLIIYTSGTTSKPKGALHTHKSITAQICMLSEAWRWQSEDSTVNCLPLNHIHGLVNLLLCSLWSGARQEILAGCDPELIWNRIEKGKLSLFMAVPTIYAKLVEYWSRQSEKVKSRLSKAAGKLRLFVSGSAALPVPLFEQWREISGKAILERYGMTETGMILGNPYDGERRPGFVGEPMPGVSVRIADTDPDEQGGELFVKSEAVFKEYWNNPGATAQCFDGEWFRTGDVVALRESCYKILGRQSVDIIKSGGYKISALEIEHVLLGHNSISEAAVVGIEDDVWGEKVAAAIVEKGSSDITPGWLKGWAGKYLAPYKLPSIVIKLNSLPRNALGKVNKPALKELIKAEIENGAI